MLLGSAPRLFLISTRREAMKLSSSSLSHLISHNLSAAHEAAVLYANGREAVAAEFLRGALEAGGAESSSPELWYMLFDLLRARGEWKSFEALTRRFEKSFGLPAPQWLDEEEMARLPAEVRPGGPGYFELAGALDATRRIELDAVRAGARNLATVHLDVSRLAAVDAEGCAAVLELLRLLPSSGNTVLLTGAEHLADLLRDAVRGDPWAPPYWSLLLEIFRLRGEQKNFERTALEYALATGASPPVWQPLMMPVAPTNQQEKRDEPRYQPGPEVFSLSGVMSGVADPQLTELRAFGDERHYVNINLSQVRRIDFSCGTAFANLVNRLAWNNKIVRLIRPNSLVAAFLSTLSLDPTVELIPARRPG
jgi:ABC-type transporter Mla MlaB component